MIGVRNLSKSCTIFDILCENTRPKQLVLQLCRNVCLLSAINNKISSNEIIFFWLWLNKISKETQLHVDFISSIGADPRELFNCSEWQSFY